MNKYPLEVQRKNDWEVKQFEDECTNYISMDTKVQAIKNQVIIFNAVVRVNIFKQHSWTEVSIMWEDGGLNSNEYKAFGLYGKYSTSFNMMQYLSHSTQLKINANDSDIKIYIDAN